MQWTYELSPVTSTSSQSRATCCVYSSQIFHLVHICTTETLFLVNYHHIHFWIGHKLLTEKYHKSFNWRMSQIVAGDGRMLIVMMFEVRHDHNSWWICSLQDDKYHTTTPPAPPPPELYSHCTTVHYCLGLLVGSIQAWCRLYRQSSLVSVSTTTRMPRSHLSLTAARPQTDCCN